MIGLFGGTFDPVHLGHLDVARAARRALNLDRVWMIPAKIPPHRGRPLATEADRVAMLRAAFNATMKDPRFLSDAAKEGAEVDPVDGGLVSVPLREAFCNDHDLDVTDRMRPPRPP